MLGALRLLGRCLGVAALVSVSSPATAAAPAVKRLASKPQAAQLQLPTLRPEQVRVESINPAIAAPVASAGPSGTTIAVKQGAQLVVGKAAGATEPTAPIALAVRVSAHSRFGDKSYEASVDPGPASLELLQSEASVDGFGLGKTTISVRQRAANKQPWPASAPLQVQLKTSRGFLAPSSVPIAAQASSGQTSLVSSSWGEAVVSESSNAGEHASTVTVAFSFPWLKFLLGFLGAAVAGALRVFTTEPGKRQGWLPVFLGCLASGVAIDILVALGAPLAPEWLLAMMRSELAWLAIGLVAGYPGVAAVAWLGEKIFAFKKPEPASAPTS